MAEVYVRLIIKKMFPHIMFNNDIKLTRQRFVGC